MEKLDWNSVQPISKALAGVDYNRQLDQDDLGPRLL